MHGRTGTEIVTRDIAQGLLKAGHRPAVYSQTYGSIAAELVAQGILVKTHVADLEDEFDVIHGHHLVTCAAALARYPQVPAIFVCHDGDSWFDEAVILPNVVRYAAVSEVLVDRVATEINKPRDQIDLVLNGVDMQRFRPGAPPSATPRTALAFAKNPQHVEAVRAACLTRNIAVDFVGGAVGKVITDPEAALLRYDLIFTSALSAIEAMACLRPVVVCDGRGLAGMVDRARYAAWRPHNFGAAVLKDIVTPETIAAEIDRYDPAEAASVGAQVREEATLDAWVRQYEQLYRRAIAEFTPADATQTRRAWARHLERWTPRASDEWRFTGERQALVTKLRRQVAGLEVMPRARQVSFGTQGNYERLVSLTGFDGGDAHSVWTSQRIASARMHLGKLDGDVLVDLTYSAFLPHAEFELEVAALVNGAPIDAWIERGWSGWRRMQRKLRAPFADCQGIATWMTFRSIPRADETHTKPFSLALHTIAVRVDAS